MAGRRREVYAGGNSGDTNLRCVLQQLPQEGAKTRRHKGVGEALGGGAAGGDKAPAPVQEPADTRILAQSSTARHLLEQEDVDG